MKWFNLVRWGKIKYWQNYYYGQVIRIDGLGKGEMQTKPCTEKYHEKGKKQPAAFDFMECLVDV